MVLTGGATLLPVFLRLLRRCSGIGRRALLEVEVFSDVVDSLIYATGVGLVQFGFTHGGYDRAATGRDEGLYTKVKSRLGSWLGRAF